MSVNRGQFRKSVRSYFKDLDRWRAGPRVIPDIFTDSLSPSEIRRKASRYRNVLDECAKSAREKISPDLDWDHACHPVSAKMFNASLHYLFTGDRRALSWCKDALGRLERCKRKYFCYSTCIGRTDVDLRTASVTLALAAMKGCFTGILDDDTLRRMTRLAVKRCLRPGLQGLRESKYFWTVRRINWRSVMCGSLGIGAMAFADDFADYPELLEYGIEGVLAVMEEGDRAGGWSEGPGYWEYGISHCAQFAWFLRVFTAGKVNLFRHSYLKKTGDFRAYMTVKPGRVWNWSDGRKQIARSLNLAILARVYGNGLHQEILRREQPYSISQLFYLDMDLKPGRLSQYPLSKIFPDLGIVVLRTGFGGKDIYVGLKGGNTGGDIGHPHVDPGSLVIHAEGRELLAEMDHWQYAQGKGKAGGFFDSELFRWDYDGNSARGHNLVEIEGQYPKFCDPGRSRILRADLGNEREVVVIDSTSFYRPLANRVRRYLIFLRPDVVVLVDEIRSRRPIRARVLYHYLDRAETGADWFSFTSGQAQLAGSSVYPSVADNVIVGMEKRRSSYHTEHDPVECLNQYVYVENLHRSRRLVFVGALHFGRKPRRRVACSLTGDPGVDSVFHVKLRKGRKKFRIKIDLNSGAARVSMAT